MILIRQSQRRLRHAACSAMRSIGFTPRPETEGRAFSGDSAEVDEEHRVQIAYRDHLSEADALLAAIEAGHDDPRDRLKALFGALSGQTDLIARYGCPTGSLCQELDKHADGPGLAAELMRAPIEWMRRQFAAMGRPDASDLAVHLLARYQGAALLTSTLRDPDLMTREAARAAEWIDGLG
jgi:TetR/AcrR family transcriptional regulator, transcriptional repressor for nem operon